MAARRWVRRHRIVVAASTAVVLLLAAVGGLFALAGHPPTGGPAAKDISKIRHVVVIMQENRSFDSCLGTFPGAEGIPMREGVPTVCVPDPARGGCERPYYDPEDKNAGGPHGQANATADIDGGKMDGFIAQAEHAAADCAANDPACAARAKTDVMGYHDGRDIPNYWAYAKDFTLQDHMFEPNASWSLPEHLYMVSEWSAKCGTAGDPQSCVNALQNPGNPPDFGAGLRNTIIGKCRAGLQRPDCQDALKAAGIDSDLAAELHAFIQQHCKATDTFASCQAAIDQADLPENLKQRLLAAAQQIAPPDYAWTDLTYLLFKQNVSWAYYVFNGTEPDCRDASTITCAPVSCEVSGVR